jgi:hypothetical protein
MGFTSINILILNILNALYFIIITNKCVHFVLRDSSVILD